MPSSSFTSSRRGFLKAGAAGVALGSMAAGAHAQTAEAPPLDQYQPEFLTPAEWAFVMAACARLIPSEGEGAGAIEARVPVFIDRQLAGSFGRADDWYMEGPFSPDVDPRLGFQSSLTPAEIYRAAIPIFDTWCRAEHGEIFANLDADAQDAALGALEQNGATSAGTGGGTDTILPPELRDFFTFLLQNTKEGYFADPKYGGNHHMAGWKLIGFPGARAAYTEWVGIDAKYPLGPVSIEGERG